MTDKGYTTIAKIEAYLGVTITDSLSIYILAAQQVIDQLTGRNFKADESATARDFDGKDGQILAIDDCIEITKVERGDNFYADSYSEIESKDDASGTDYYITLPHNNDAENLPINRVLLRNRYWTVGIGNQRITAKWGFSETPPDDISMAATIIAAGMYNANRLEGQGNVTSEKIGNYAVSFDTKNGQSKWNDFESAKSIIKSYEKILL